MVNLQNDFPNRHPFPLGFMLPHRESFNLTTILLIRILTNLSTIAHIQIKGDFDHTCATPGLRTPVLLMVAMLTK